MMTNISFPLVYFACILAHLALFFLLEIDSLKTNFPAISSAISLEGVVYSGCLWALLLFGSRLIIKPKLANASSGKPSRQTQKAARNQEPVEAPVKKRSEASQRIQNDFEARLNRAINVIHNEEVIKKWQGWKEFTIVRKEFESEDNSICSFYLSPAHPGPIPKFYPGQFLTFYFPDLNNGKPVTRCYSLSDCNQENTYRISVKRQMPPRNKPDARPGLSSNHLHVDKQVGDTLYVQAPAGNFYLNESSNKGVVLLAGGVGLTLMVSIAKHLAEQGSSREVHFFYGVSYSSEYACLEEIKTAIAQLPNAYLYCCVSRDEKSETEIASKLGIQAEQVFPNRISLALLQEKLSSSNYEYYLCGSSVFTEGLVQDLKSWNVPTKDIHYEPLEPIAPKKVATGSFKVRFEESDADLDWKGEETSLLQFSEDHDIELPSGCRMGNCGACKTTVTEGQVDYPGGKPGYEQLEADECLTCVGVPKSNLVLKA